MNNSKLKIKHYYMTLDTSLEVGIERFVKWYKMTMRYKIMAKTVC